MINPSSLFTLAVFSRNGFNLTLRTYFKNLNPSALQFTWIYQHSNMEFKLRPWHINDLESLVKHANNFNIAKNMTNQFEHPYTTARGEHFIKTVAAQSPSHVFAIDVNGAAVGGIGVHPQSDIQCKNAELGYWLAESFWGHGIMTRAIPQMIAYGFKTWDIDRIFARPFGTNTAAQKVLEKTGFKLEARFKNTLYKNGEFVDELIYAIRRNEFEY